MLTLKRIVLHLVLPAILPVFFFVIAATPVEVLGCYNRGLIALITALISSLLALTSVLIAIWRRNHGDLQSHWFVFTALVLVIPIIGLLILA